jgi:CheY-like chemotaxis protein
VVGNLLSNAVKFTERGRVTLRVSATAADDQAGDPELVFSVVDTGIGIAPENLAVIFGAFQQGDGTLSRRYGGTGLGLSIASQVSALLGGQITATSDLGRGSTFTLRVPATLPAIPPFDDAADAFAALAESSPAPDGLIGYAAPAGRPGRGSQAAAEAAPEEISQPLRAAMADITRAATSIIASGPGARDDDSVPVALIAGAAVSGTAATVTAIAGPPAGAADGAVGQDRNVLVFEGTSGGLLTLLAYSAISDLAGTSTAVRVSTAVGPSQGVAMLAAEPFRCVVVDLAMPTALEFLEQVQEKPELREVPVLAYQSAQPDRATMDRFAALRSAYPTLELLPSLDELRERITLHLSAARPGQVPAFVGNAVAAAETPRRADELADDEHPELRGKHVLVIDDDARNVFAITSSLELHGIEVTHASDGRQGIEVLRANPETDLILTDIMMPGMDGYATMTAIRQMPEFESLPIIAVTARAMPSDREKSLAAGANDYVTKPVDTDELIACMERWLASA